MINSLFTSIGKGLVQQGTRVNPPSIMTDGNTLRFQASNLATLTKSGINLSAIKDIYSDVSAVNATEATQPEWYENGILFNGVLDFLKTPEIASLVQPSTVYLVFQQKSWKLDGYVFDGYEGDSGMVYQNGVSPNLTAHAGAGLAEVSVPLNTWSILRITYNGVNSVLQLNDETPITGNVGIGNMLGVTLGRRAAIDNYTSNVQIRDFIVRKGILDSQDNNNKIYTYLRRLYSNNFLPTFIPMAVEPGAGVHSSGYDYTSFSSGCMFKGKEIHVCRSAKQHQVPAISENNIIFYTRNSDGTFTTKILDILYNKDYRDPNLAITNDGLYLILTLEATEFGDTGYTNDMYILNENLDILYSYKDTIPNFFGFGNCLQTPSGKFLKTAYRLTAGAGVDLFRSTGNTVDNVGVWSNIASLFASSDNQPTECTISRWGDKLIAITRQDSGTDLMLYSETSNLEGDNGWSTPVTITDKKGTVIVGQAPAMPTYTPSNESLILTESTWIGGSNRDPAIISTNDGVTWSTEVRLISQVSNGGGYNSLIKISKDVYAMMWYEDMNSGTYTQSKLWYKQFDVKTYIPECVT